MFIGEYNHALDDKSRMAIPIKFRGGLKGGAVVTRGLDNCLFVYPMVEWRKMAEKLAKLPISQAKSRAFARLMLAGAMQLDIDKQGRVILPEYLKKYAGLKKKAVIAGLFNRIEIWDQTVWEAYKTSSEKDSSEIAETLGELGV